MRQKPAVTRHIREEADVVGQVAGCRRSLAYNAGGRQDRCESELHGGDGGKIA